MQKTITVERIVPATPERVYQAWLSPDDLREWYSASDGWSIPYAEVDARVGGRFKIGFQSPNATEKFDFTGTYTELVPSQKIAYTTDDHRLVTVTLEPIGDATKVVEIFEMETINSEEQQRVGWTAQVDHLIQYLSK